MRCVCVGCGFWCGGGGCLLFCSGFSWVGGGGGGKGRGTSGQFFDTGSFTPSIFTQKIFRDGVGVLGNLQKCDFWGAKSLQKWGNA